MDEDLDVMVGQSPEQGGQESRTGTKIDMG